MLTQHIWVRQRGTSSYAGHHSTIHFSNRHQERRYKNWQVHGKSKVQSTSQTQTCLAGLVEHSSTNCQHHETKIFPAPTQQNSYYIYLASFPDSHPGFVVACGTKTASLYCKRQNTGQRSGSETNVYLVVVPEPFSVPQDRRGRVARDLGVKSTRIHGVITKEWSYGGQVNWQ